MSSTSDIVSGKVKQAVGSVTNNRKLEAKGKFEETKGKAKNNLKHAADKVTSAINHNK